MKRYFTISFALALALCVTGVRAADDQNDSIEWIPIFNGIELATRQVEEPLQRIVVARIDLTAPGIAIKTTPPNEKFEPETRETWRETTPMFLKNNHLALAVNGNFYTPFGGITITTGGDSNLRGLGASDGFIESQPEEGFPSFVVKENGDMEIRQYALDEPLDGIAQAVSGPAIVLSKGEVCKQEDPAIHPRTGIGYSKDQRYLFLMTIDGRRPEYSEGATLEDVGKALLYFGAYDGLNLDGGGSTTMVARDSAGEPVVLNWPINKISPDGLRFNGNAIGVTAQGDPLIPFDKALKLYWEEEQNQKRAEASEQQAE